MSKEKIVKYIFLMFLFFFFILLFAERNGYYETNTTKAKKLTEEQIKKFENDLKEGKDIDITEYVNYKKIDYSNDLSNGIYKISLKLEDGVDKVIKYIFKKASNTINE